MGSGPDADGFHTYIGPVFAFGSSGSSVETGAAARPVDSSHGGSSSSAALAGAAVPGGLAGSHGGSPVTPRLARRAGFGMPSEPGGGGGARRGPALPGGRGLPHGSSSGGRAAAGAAGSAARGRLAWVPCPMARGWRAAAAARRRRLLCSRSAAARAAISTASTITASRSSEPARIPAPDRAAVDVALIRGACVTEGTGEGVAAAGGACRAARVAAAVSAPAASRAPWPAPAAAWPVTPRSMACTTAAAVRPGNRERISAATPAASAADMSVLASVPYPSPPGAATVRPAPGAVSAT